MGPRRKTLDMHRTGQSRGGRLSPPPPSAQWSELRTMGHLRAVSSFAKEKSPGETRGGLR